MGFVLKSEITEDERHSALKKIGKELKNGG